MNDGSEPIADVRIRERLRRQGRMVYVKSGVAAGAVVVATTAGADAFDVAALTGAAVVPAISRAAAEARSIEGSRIIGGRACA